MENSSYGPSLYSYSLAAASSSSAPLRPPLALHIRVAKRAETSKVGRRRNRRAHFTGNPDRSGDTPDRLDSCTNALSVSHAQSVMSHTEQPRLPGFARAFRCSGPLRLLRLDLDRPAPRKQSNRYIMQWAGARQLRLRRSHRDLALASSCATKRRNASILGSWVLAWAAALRSRSVTLKHHALASRACNAVSSRCCGVVPIVCEVLGGLSQICGWQAKYGSKYSLS
jgi:hypothetical protein